MDFSEEYKPDKRIQLSVLSLNFPLNLNSFQKLRGLL